MTIKVWSPDHLQNHMIQLVQTLNELGYAAEFTRPDPKDKALHIIACPFMLHKLPENYIVYNVENNERFLEGQVRGNEFNNAKQIWCHTRETINLLYQAHPIIASLKFPKFIPPGKVMTVPVQKKIDFALFYGAWSERREKILTELKYIFHLPIDIMWSQANNTKFGTDMLEKLMSYKVVINLHWNKTAVLETFRIHEALCQNCHVISEPSDLTGLSVDYERHVYFTKNVMDMAHMIYYLLGHEFSFTFDSSILDNREYIKRALEDLK